jgi:hypothetical protein
MSRKKRFRFFEICPHSKIFAYRNFANEDKAGCCTAKISLRAGDIMSSYQAAYFIFEK